MKNVYEIAKSRKLDTSAPGVVHAIEVELAMNRLKSTPSDELLATLGSYVEANIVNASKSAEQLALEAAFALLSKRQTELPLKAKK
jgi:hypothetical protein